MLYQTKRRQQLPTSWYPIFFSVFRPLNSSTPINVASLSLLHEVCRSLGIHKTRTTAYHPQGDGLVERFNRTLLSMLATTAKDHPATWETFLPKLCNTSIQASTGYTPFYLMFGREARLPVDIMFRPPHRCHLT